MDTDKYEVAVSLASSEGLNDGLNAAGWFIDTTMGAEAAKRMLQAIEDGDPEIIDQLPHPDLSGEFAGTVTGPQLVEYIAGNADLTEEEGQDIFNEICDAYEWAYIQAAHEEIVNNLRHLADN